VPLQSSKASDLKHFLFWAVTKGQTGPYTAKLRFVPLPKSVLVVAEKAIAKIHS
jgi:ABC-type phosphate transport system substrate-binding protein